MTIRKLPPGVTKREILEAMSYKVYGMSRTTGLRKRICINCRGDMTAPGLLLSPENQKQYIKSGLCPACYQRSVTEKV